MTAGPTTRARAPVVEIFASLQGEGRFVGRPTVFVRTATCPLRCLYCDTPESYTAPANAAVTVAGEVGDEPNPMTAARVVELAELAGHEPIVSLTGGEPLVFPEFAHDLGMGLHDRGVRLHLETAAVHPEALERCIDVIDHVSADYKLPETLGAPNGDPEFGPDGDYADRHVQCYEIAARAGVSLDVKLVLTPECTPASFERALARLEPLRPALTLILQPVTPFGAVRSRVSSESLREFVAAAQRQNFQFRVLPQVHKLLGLP